MRRPHIEGGFIVDSDAYDVAHIDTVRYSRDSNVEAPDLDLVLAHMDNMLGLREPLLAAFRFVAMHTGDGVPVTRPGMVCDDEWKWEDAEKLRADLLAVIDEIDSTRHAMDVGIVSED